MANIFMLWLQTASAATRYMFALWLMLGCFVIGGFVFLLTADLGLAPGVEGNVNLEPAGCNRTACVPGQRCACDGVRFEPAGSISSRWVDAKAK
eukprot:SAG31_NODE_13021_length_899_cov_1.047500_2_plen_93_part_01